MDSPSTSSRNEVFVDTRGFFALLCTKDPAHAEVSFLIMQEHGLTEALTTDHHFRVARFIPLLTPRTTPDQKS